jgi:uncharacterized membrane protein YgcG
VDGLLQNVIDNLGSVESWLKVLFLVVTMPLWVPIARTMWTEVNEVLAPEGGLYANRAKRAIRRRGPGEDPFLNIPLASHRQARRASGGSRGGGSRGGGSRGGGSREATHELTPAAPTRPKRAGLASPRSSRLRHL